MLGAHCAMSVRPISVDPVKVSMRTVGFVVNSLPITLTFRDHVEDTLGMPALLGKLGQRQCRQRRSRRVSAPSCSPPPVPPVQPSAWPRGSSRGVIAATTPTGCFDHDDTCIRLEGRDGFAVNALPPRQRIR